MRYAGGAMNSERYSPGGQYGYYYEGDEDGHTRAGTSEVAAYFHGLDGSRYHKSCTAGLHIL